MTSITHGDGGAVTFLEDRYTLGAVIGEGAVGRVYVAFDKVLGIDVAVKVMHAQHVKSTAMLQRFANEAALSARMLSPHVVRVLGLAITRDGAPCIIYELLEGETLGAFLERRGTLSLEETSEIVKQVSRALARVHALGVVHRDVKPDNIFITTQANGHALIKLLDFGVAGMMTPGEVNTEVVGTPEYMAPEVLFGGAVLDARVDVYALGVIAFECLTGACPFTGKRFMEIFSAVQAGSRSSLREIRKDLAPAVDEWVDCALQPDPYWRFPSAKELSAALESATAASVSGKHAIARVAIRRAA